MDLLDFFHETTYQTEMGQLVDLITSPEDKVDLSKFFLERYTFPFPSFSLSNTKQPPHNSHLQNCLLLLLPPRCMRHAIQQHPLVT